MRPREARPSSWITRERRHAVRRVQGLSLSRLSKARRTGGGPGSGRSGDNLMPWNGSAAMPFTLSSVHLYAPKMSGVYALFADKAWFYVGESDTISKSLMNH